MPLYMCLCVKNDENDFVLACPELGKAQPQLVKLVKVNWKTEYMIANFSARSCKRNSVVNIGEFKQSEICN